MKELAAFKKLEELLLLSVPIVDAGLRELAALKGLRKLFLSRTKVTPAGVKELRKALPECDIRN